jgi:hypothetical protein
VTAPQSAAAAHSATVASQWQQHRGCGGFPGTVRKCADARAFDCHRHADVRIFVLGQGWRDDSADIVVVGSDGGARGDVHRGRRCAASTGNDAADDDTANANVIGDADDIIC